MPARNKNKRIQQKKLMRRRRKFQLPAISTKTIVPLIMPDRYRCKMKYASFYTLSAASTIQGYVLRANSLFDPDFTGVGAQPNGFDELAALYDKYRVYASAIRIDAIPGTSGLGSFLDVAVLPTVTSAPIFSTIEETQGNYRAKIMHTTGTNAGHIRKMTSFVNMSKFLGKRVEFDDIDSAQTTASPNQPVYWIVYVQPSDQSTNASGRIKFVITYYVEFYKRKFLGHS